MKNLVSVITPAYNCEQFIGVTIKSVVEQTYKNWEMIIVDDCSNDSTSNIVKKYCECDNRIKYLRLDINSGAAVARNTGLKYANGRYIAFLDSDDIWKYNKLERQINFMKKNNYGFTFTEYEMITECGVPINKRVEIPSKVTYKDILKNTIIGCLTVIIDKEIIGEFSMPNVRRGQDTMTWTSILRNGNVAYGLQENLAFYRVVKSSLSNNKMRALKRTWDNYRNIENLSFVKCTYYFTFYIFNAFKKHYF